MEKLYANVENNIDWEKARTGPPENFPAIPTIPGRRYTDEEFYQLELKHVWHKSWVCAGREEGLEAEGQYRIFEKLGVPVVLVRGKDAKLRAFYNMCRHRGAPVVRDQKGKTNLLRCPYHSWSYGLDGRLIALPDERDFAALDKQDRSLIEVACETWGGLVFINLDANPPCSLQEHLGSLTKEWECLSLGSLRVVHEQSYIIDCNWKAAEDAFLEVYHLNHIHGTNAGLMFDSAASAMGLLPNGHSRMVTRKNMDQGFNFSEYEGAPEIPTVPEFYYRNNVAYTIFPSIVTPIEPTGFPLLLFYPRGTRQTEMVALYLGPDWGEGQRPEFWDNYLPIFDGVLQEDMVNLAPLQASLESGVFESIMINYQERRIYWLHEEIDRRIGASNIPQGLAVQQVLGNFVEDGDGGVAGAG